MSHLSFGHENEPDAAGKRFHWPHLRVSRPAALRAASLKLIVITGLSIIATIAFCFGLLQTSLFAVQRIDITGLSHLQRSDILALAQVRTDEAMISVNDGKVVNRIETNPWVEAVKVKSAWPHVVKIAVTERKAIGQAQTSNKEWAVIGTDGVVLEVNKTPSNALPDLLDVTAPAQPGVGLDVNTQTLTDIAGLMPTSLEGHVKQIQGQNGNYRLGLDTGTIVELGNGTDLSDKLMAASAVVSHTDAKKLSVLDVRSPHLPIGTPVTPISPPPSSSSQSTSSSKSKSNTTISKSTTTTSTTIVTSD